MEPAREVLELQIGSKTITLETGFLAPQANGSVVVRCGETMVLVTATMSLEKKDLDFFPMIVDTEDKMYAVGRIPGSFMRREGRPSDTAILTSRVNDRQLRPLFPKGFRNDIQIVAAPLSSDQIDQPDVLCMIGASAALTLSNIPFNGPTAAVRIGLINDEWVINPTFPEIDESSLDLIVAGTHDSINMVEAGANALSEEKMLEAISLAHEEIKKITSQLIAWREKIGKPKFEPEIYTPSEEIAGFVKARIGEKLAQAMSIADNLERKAAVSALGQELKQAVDELPEGDSLKALVLERRNDIRNIVDDMQKKLMRQQVLEKDTRIDGRKPADLRSIYCDVGLIPRTHGSGLFMRGNTQALSLTTLGSLSDAQPLDGMIPQTSKRYVHHYNFPPYSVGEVRPMRGASRRDIGHGTLAERALLPVLPPEEDFPYAIRVVSEVLSSNGSTSMASTCASTLTLMDAGVPLKDMVGGIAMGLIKEGAAYKILTDIQGVEDNLGDMDFKVAGTRDGITALQMDIKIAGISVNILQEAMEQARIARLSILDKMKAVIAEPRPDLSPYAPRIIIIHINPSKIGAVIGPGGKVIKQIVEQLDVKIDIEDDGSVFIITPNAESAAAAEKWIRDLTEEAEIGKVYNGRVVRLTSFGAFIEILPQQDGLLHISAVPGRPRHIEDVLHLDDEILVRVEEIDSQGRLNLALEQELEVPEYSESSGPPRRDREGGGGGDRGRGGPRYDRGGRGGGGGDRGRRPGGGGGAPRGGGGGGGERRGPPPGNNW